MADDDPSSAGRNETRRMVRNGMTVFCLSGTFGHMVEMEVMDRSGVGLGAQSEIPLAPGTAVAIGFECREFLASRGIVMTCERNAVGYHVAIRLEGRR